VQLAQMANRAGQSEMRIGLNTAAFGSVEVRTVVRSGDVGLTIGSEKGDLHGLLSNEMPALTSNLQQQNLRLNNVSFTQGSGFSNGSNGSNNMTGGGSQQQGSSTPQPAPPSFQTSWNNEDFAAEAPEVPAQPFSYDGGSLSILA
jgi:flagellar hook-length control protein FliK